MQIDLRSSVVSDTAGKEVEVVAPSRGIWGTAGIGGLNIDKDIKSELRAGAGEGDAFSLRSGGRTAGMSGGAEH